MSSQTKIKCDECKGKGTIFKWNYDKSIPRFDHRDFFIDPCQKCRGTGEVDKPKGMSAARFNTVTSGRGGRSEARRNREGYENGGSGSFLTNG